MAVRKQREKLIDMLLYTNCSGIEAVGQFLEVATLCGDSKEHDEAEEGVITTLHELRNPVPHPPLPVLISVSRLSLCMLLKGWNGPVSFLLAVKRESSHYRGRLI